MSSLTAIDYGLLLDAFADAVIASDGAGRIVYANRAVERLLGWSPAELVGKDLTTIMPERLRPAHRVGFERYLRTREARLIGRPVRLPALHRSGEEIQVELTLAAYRLQNGDDLIVGSVRDLRERIQLEREVANLRDIEVLAEDLKRQRAALAESESRARRLQDSGVIGVVFWELDGRLVDANDAFLRMLGYTREELLSGKLNWRALTPPEFQALDEQAVREVRESGVIQPFEKEYLHKDGHRVPVELGAALWETSDSAGVAWILDTSERKRLERQRAEAVAELERQHHLVRTITDNASAALFLVGEGSVCTFMNAAAEAMTGFSMREALGHSMHELVHHHRPDGSVYPASECPLVQALSRGTGVRGEETLIRRDGTFFPVAFSASPIFEGGHAVSTVIEFRDITDEKRARDELDLQSHILETLAEGVSVMHSNGVIAYTNRAEDEMFGYQRGELVGQHVTVQNSYPPAENQRIVDEVIATLHDKGLWAGEWQSIKQDGTIFVTRSRITRLERGEGSYFVCVQNDVTQEKREHEAASFLASLSAALTSSVELEASIARVTQLVVSRQADLCVVYLEGEAGQLLPAGSAAVDAEKGELLRELIESYPVESALAERFNVMKRQRGLVVPEVTDPMLAELARDPEHLRLMRRLGVVSYLAAPLLVQGRAIGGIGLSRCAGKQPFDAFDLETLEEAARRIGVALENARLFELSMRERRRAEEANRAKDELLSITSHELRTPLNAILGWARMLRTGNLDGAKQEHALEAIERNAKVQVQLVDDILDVSRVITGKLRLDIATIAPARFAEAAVEVVRPAAEAKGVSLLLSIDPNTGLVRGDSGRLQQVCWNLLANAVKFTPVGGRVEMKVARDDGQVTITVTDSGEGIEPAFLPHVFEPFRQQDASVTRAQGGLGLGLAIVKHVVELHGGRIEAHSRGPGRGATFVVYIPDKAPRDETYRAPSEPVTAAAEHATPFRSPELGGLRALVVEDDPDARELLKSALERCRAEVTVTSSVAEALLEFERRPPDVLVSDIGMAGESGYDLIRRIRKLPAEAGGAVPAVAVTAYASPADRARVLEAGFTAHAGKPFDPQELVIVIAALANAPG